MVDALAAFWLGVPPGTIRTLGDWRAALGMIVEARADFAIAVALGISLAMAKPNERGRLLEQMTQISLTEQRVPKDVMMAGLRMMGIGVQAWRSH